MNSILGEQLMAAQEASEKAAQMEAERIANDPSCWVWKEARNSKKEQVEVKLLDATEAQLNRYYKHCMSMLYSTDKDNPGRHVLLDILEDQKLRCNTELFLRWMENSYEPTDRMPIKRSTYLTSLSTLLSKNADVFPKDRSLIMVEDITDGVPNEFKNIPISYVIDGCMHQLGLYNRKHMTLKFIATKLGLCFSQDEMREFSEESKRCGKKRIDIVKERCNLRPNIVIQVGADKALNFKEFRSLVLLRNKNYADMTTDQLETLRNKGLFGLSIEVNHHIDQWEDIIAKLKTVAEMRSIKLNDC